ncbi:MAG: [acyl-carrier-protein] S-malonyltransferase [Desulfovibrio sp.]|nr:MAG: [acyl-carrier-protein] S-malonyltransferase [Desulfovibrio sp.]
MSSTPLAVLFPGQGSQEAGMGRELAEAHKEAMDLWKQAERISGIDLRGIYGDGDELAMADTRNLQPALTAVDLGYWSYVASKLSPVMAAGHSLGEYSALAAASVLSVDSVLELTSLRGRLMAEADPSGQGAMGAILKLDLDTVEQVVADCREATNKELLVANYNSPAQYVISGHKEAVEAAAPMVKEKKGRLVPLPVSGAFHSPLMAEAAKELATVIAKLDWRKPAFPVVCNVTGQAETDADTIKDLMSRQMTSSVQWITTMNTMWQSSIRTFVEVGPKVVLTRLAGANLKDVTDDYTTQSINSLEAADELNG